MLSQLYPLIKPIPIFQAGYLTPNRCTFEYPSWDNFSDLSLDWIYNYKTAILSPKLKTGYRYENQFKITNGVRQV